ncbi:MAG: hypothetical protein K9H64_14520 [Bacteroidales bacterium]|nr:hypothetical protein [Bacteroidales bacterium]MCF8457210.1 hypothetical protein [Bacteroidales bacterium]
MAHIPLFYVLPDVAIKENRSLIVDVETSPLPLGTYNFIELFCDDPGCDCRDVIIEVTCQGQESPLATMRYGWEDFEYYRKFIGANEINDEVIDHKAPALTGDEQSKYADILYKVFRDFIKDQGYVKRIEKHYFQFKEEISKRAKNVEQGVQK